MRFVFIFLMVNFLGWTQTGNVSGTVTINGNEPAIGATVKVEGTDRSAVANENGHFEIRNLNYGEYVLRISSVGSKTKSQSVLLNNPSLQLDILIEQTDAKALQEVTVKKISAKREIVSKGFAVNVIETQEAAKRNLQTNDLLDRSVGVRIRQNGGLGSSVDYNLNGMSGNSIRIFIDGIPITTYGSSFNLNSIPPALIERIEVYKGVIPAHLADDALGGAINVVLKKGARNTLNAAVSYGSFNTLQSNFNGTFRSKSGFTVKASGFQNYSDNDYEVWGKFVYNIPANGKQEYVRVKRFNDAYKSFGGRMEAGFTDVKWADNFMIGYNGSHDYNQIQHGQYMTTPYKGRFTESDAHVFSLNYSKKDFLIKRLEFTTNTVYSQRTQVINDTVKWRYNWQGELVRGLHGEKLLTQTGAQQGMPTINHIKRNIFSTRSGLSYNINDNHKLVFSNLFNVVDRDENDEMKTEMERTFRETRDLQKSISSLAYELQAFDSHLRANVFGKYYTQKIAENNPELSTGTGPKSVIVNVYENTNSAYGYGLATSYFITPELMVLASAEKAIRMPTEDELFGNPGENVVSNSDLKPEVSNNLNVGFRVGPYKINQHKFSAAASGFWRNSKDKIVRQINERLNDAIQTSPSVNLGKAQSLGFEASLDYAYKNKWFASVNLSKFNSLYKIKYDNNGNILDRYNQQLPNEPFFTINANVQHNFKNVVQTNSELNLYYNCGYVAPFYTNWLEIDRYRTTPQFVQDLGFSYFFPKKQFVVSFDARNIFDKQVYDNFAAQKPGRAFYIKVNYTINYF